MLYQIPPFQVAWNDMLLALQYQGNLVKVYKSHGVVFSNSRAPEPSASSEPPALKHSPLPMPRDHYDGPTFHALLFESRVELGLVDDSRPSEEEKTAEEVLLAGAVESTRGKEVARVDGGGAKTSARDGWNDDTAYGWKGNRDGWQDEDDDDEDAAAGTGERYDGGFRDESTPPIPEIKLPIDDYKDQILQHIRDNQVSSLVG